MAFEENAEQSESFRAFANIIWAISSDYDHLKTYERQLHEKSVINVECSEKDYPKLVGSSGKNVNALALLYALATYAENGIDGNIIIPPPKNQNRAKRETFQYNPNWGIIDLRGLAKPLCRCIFQTGTCEVTDMNRGTLLLSIVVHDFNGETYLSYSGRKKPIDWDKVVDAFCKVFKSVCKANGRDIEVEMINRETPDTSGRS